MIRSRFLIFAVALLIATSLAAWGQVLISVNFGPPALPVYAQPLCPAPGYIWAPGYWAYSPDGYFWVPGTWVLAPQPGYLWTPGYWGYNDGLYNWYPGYWGPQVGFYGGVNYGFGYPGNGYYGGYWRGNDFYYNRAVNNVNVTNVRVYNQTVVNNVNQTRVSYNGGPGGVQARPTQAQIQARNERHTAPTSAQVQHEQAARSDRGQFASANHGHPATVATTQPGAFHASEAGRGSAPGNRGEPAPREGNANAHPVPRPPAENHNPSERVNDNARAPERAPSRPPEHNDQQAREPNNPPRETQGERQPPRETQAAPVHSRNEDVGRPPEGERPAPIPRTESAPRPNAERPPAEARPPAGAQREAGPPARENGHPPENREKPDDRPH